MAIRPFLLRFAAWQAALSALGFALWLQHTFGEVTVEQAYWHLLYADGPAMQMSEVFFVQCLVEVLAIPFVLAALAALLHEALLPRLAGWQRTVLRSGPVVVAAGAVGALAVQFSVVSYAASYFGADHFAQHFVDPGEVTLVQETRRNLVLIYAESMESGYADALLFSGDLMAPLQRQRGHSYAWYRPVPGATWTIAGMVATQCGVPLKVYAQADIRRRDAGKVFLPGATCLGDVLQAHGYRNVFLGGAPLSFSGKGRFLQDHGYAETWGREEWERAGAPPRDFNAWGMFDPPLFAHAKRKLAQLHESGQPFMLTMLTLDTHNPFGFMSQGCRNRGATDFRGIVGCSAAEIAELVDFARRRGYLKDTAFVVIGDHLAMPNPVQEQLVQAGERRGMYNRFIGEQLPAANTTELRPFDLFPTLLEVAGIRVQGGRLALGHAAVGGPLDGRTAYADLALAATRPSPSYDRLWQASVVDD